jgi:hypothetical protein
LVDVRVDQTYTSVLGLFATYTTTVHANAVKWLKLTVPDEGISPDSASEVLPESFQMQQPTTTLPFFQGEFGHALSLSLGNFSGDEGGSAVRFGYSMRGKGRPITLSPTIGYAVLPKEITSIYSVYFYDYGTGRYVYRRYEDKSKIDVRLITLDLDATANLGSFSAFQGKFPAGLNPFVDAGFTYMIWEAWDDWDFFQAGLNIGIGAEYFVKPNVSLLLGLKRYIIFGGSVTGDFSGYGYEASGSDLDFWNWQIGVTFYPAR